MERILQVVTHMNRGGLETMLMNYYRCIDRNKVQFDFLTHRDYEGDYGEEIKNLGGRVYHLPVLNPFSEKYKRELGHFFDEHKEYRVIHVHQDCLSAVILKVAKEHGIPVRISHSHCASQDKDIKYPIKMFYKHFIPKYATDLMACGEEAGQWMFGGAEFSVLNNAIDANRYIFNSYLRQNQRTQWNVNEKEVLVGHVGRFSPQKNHLFLIDIFYELQKKTNAKLMLVGNDHGDIAEQVKEKISRLGINDKVIFTGLRSDVADILQAMDVFVFPSNYEGLPVTMVEAQASGLPCLISDKVPIQCKMTDLVEQIPLSDGAKVWAERIIETGKIERRNTCCEIQEAGFDIGENAKRLQAFYQGRLKEC